MLKIFINWEKKINDSLAGKEKVDFEHLEKDHRKFISYLQHERFIHLLVMLFVGLFGLLSIYFTLLLDEIWLLPLDILFMGLTVPYIFHYRDLENTTQRWYELGEKIKEKGKTHA